MQKQSKKSGISDYGTIVADYLFVVYIRKSISSLANRVECTDYWEKKGNKLRSPYTMRPWAQD